MQVERVMIDELDCDPANVRAHDSKNLDAIKSSLRRFGQQKPIVVNEKGIVIAGNGTLTAARALGWDSINIVKTVLEGSEATAYAIADNRTGELAEWDEEALAKQLSALQIEDEALVEAAGFSDAELTALVDEVTGITEGNTDPDEVPEVPEDPTAQPGQIWQLGDHRLMCGNSTSAEDVAALMDGEPFGFIHTDPPYGIDAVPVSVAGGSKSFGPRPNAPGLANNYAPIMNDDSTDTAKKFIDMHARKAPGVIWGCNYYATVLPESRCWLVWDKKGRQWDDNFSDFELAWTSADKRAKIFTHVWMGMVQSGEREKRVHPTQKPAALVGKVLEYVQASGIVFDGFLGSGSTLIACEQTGRKCYGMELSPAYCDVIIKRWEDFTGQTAELVNV